MKFFFLLKIWKNTNNKGYTLGPALAHFSVRWGQGPSAGGRKVFACPQLCRGNRHVREEEVEGALQSTAAIALSPQAACESRRRRLTCLFSSLILYSLMKELRSNLIEWERCQQKGKGESISPLTIHLALQSVKNHLISFVKVCFSIIANYSSTVLQSLKMLMDKHTCFYSEEHLASCHGVTASVTFPSSYGNYHLAEWDSDVWQGKQRRMRLKFVFYCSDLFLQGFRWRTGHKQLKDRGQIKSLHFYLLGTLLRLSLLSPF